MWQLASVAKGNLRVPYGSLVKGLTRYARLCSFETLSPVFVGSSMRSTTHAPLQTLYRYEISSNFPRDLAWVGSG